MKPLHLAGPLLAIGLLTALPASAQPWGMGPAPRAPEFHGGYGPRDGYEREAMRRHEWWRMRREMRRREMFGFGSPHRGW